MYKDLEKNYRKIFNGVEEKVYLLCSIVLSIIFTIFNNLPLIIMFFFVIIMFLIYYGILLYKFGKLNNFLKFKKSFKTIRYKLKNDRRLKNKQFIFYLKSIGIDKNDKLLLLIEHYRNKVNHNSLIEYSFNICAILISLVGLIVTILSAYTNINFNTLLILLSRLIACFVVLLITICIFKVSVINDFHLLNNINKSLEEDLTIIFLNFNKYKNNKYINLYH